MTRVLTLSSTISITTRTVAFTFTFPLSFPLPSPSLSLSFSCCYSLSRCKSFALNLFMLQLLPSNKSFGQKAHTCKSFHVEPKLSPVAMCNCDSPECVPCQVEEFCHLSQHLTFARLGQVSWRLFWHCHQHLKSAWLLKRRRWNNTKSARETHTHAHTHRLTRHAQLHASIFIYTPGRPPRISAVVIFHDEGAWRHRHGAPREIRAESASKKEKSNEWVSWIELTASASE